MIILLQLKRHSEFDFESSNLNEDFSFHRLLQN